MYQYPIFNIFEDIYLQLDGYIYVHVSGFGELKQFHHPWNYDARAVYVFDSF